MDSEKKLEIIFKELSNLIFEKITKEKIKVCYSRNSKLLSCTNMGYIKNMCNIQILF